MLYCLTVAPAMQAIIVDCIPVVDPQLAAVIGDDAEAIMACSANLQFSCPTHSEVVASSEPTPFPVCVAIVHHLAGKENTSSAPFNPTTSCT